MTLGQALRQSTETLTSHNISEAQLEAEVLLMHVAGLSRAQLYSRLERELPPDQAQGFADLIVRRIQGEPTAYITGHKEFYGHDFEVDPRVLIPRPETELLVEKALEFAKGYTLPPRGISLTMADIGTGCGAIAISLALELPQAKIYATDLSSDALEVARSNCGKHGVEHRIQLLWGDMLHPLPEPVHLMVANLPYVKDAEIAHLSQEITGFEPAMALAGGADGLDRIRQLLAEARRKLRPRGVLLVEIDPRQSQAAIVLVQSCFSTSEARVAKDLGGLDRVVIVAT